MKAGGKEITVYSSDIVAQDLSGKEREVHAPGCGQPFPWTVPPDACLTEAVCQCFPDLHEPDPEEATPSGKATPDGIAVGKLLSEIRPERVDWLWPGRIPRNKLTLFDGDPGLGKSALTTDLAARVSVGRPWPDDSPCEPGGVVLCSAEDGIGDTVRPRLDAAGGDAERVLALATVPDGDAERLISVPEDLDVLRRGIERVSAALVIVDPLMAFLSGDVNSHRDQDVRRALAPLARLAEGTGVAVVVVRHLNKATGATPSTGVAGASAS